MNAFSRLTRLADSYRRVNSKTLEEDDIRPHQSTQPSYVVDAETQTCPSTNVDPKPKPNLTSSLQSSINVSPKNHVPNLMAVKMAPLSIPPRRIYHPNIINACKQHYSKHPSQLNPEEVEKFKFYKEYYEREYGKTIEEDVIFRPAGMRDCLHCGYPT